MHFDLRPVIPSRWSGTNARLTRRPAHRVASVLAPIGCGVLAIATILGFSQTATPSHTPKPLLMPEANRLPDANEQMQMREQQAKKHNYEAANVERTRQIAADSALLVELATRLKAELNKNSQGPISIEAIRRIEAIEKLAHGVKEKMKLTMGAG
jgi:hypothetical protein